MKTEEIKRGIRVLVLATLWLLRFHMPKEADCITDKLKRIQPQEFLKHCFISGETY